MPCLKIDNVKNEKLFSAIFTYLRGITKAGKVEYWARFRVGAKINDTLTLTSTLN